MSSIFSLRTESMDLSIWLWNRSQLVSAGMPSPSLARVLASGLRPGGVNHRYPCAELGYFRVDAVGASRDIDLALWCCGPNPASKWFDQPRWAPPGAAEPRQSDLWGAKRHSDQAKSWVCCQINCAQLMRADDWTEHLGSRTALMTHAVDGTGRLRCRTEVMVPRSLCETCARRILLWQSTGRSVSGHRTR